MRRGYRKKVGMIFSARTEADVYGRGMLEWWRTKHRNFDYKVTLTREQKPGFLHGHVSAVLPGLYPDLSQHSVFIAGSTAFVDHCVAAVRLLGAQEPLIHKEGYFEFQDARNQGRPG